MQKVAENAKSCSQVAEHNLFMPKSKFYFLSGRKFLIRSSFVRAATRLYHCRIFYGKCSPAEGKKDFLVEEY